MIYQRPGWAALCVGEKTFGRNLFVVLIARTPTGVGVGRRHLLRTKRLRVNVDNCDDLVISPPAIRVHAGVVIGTPQSAQGGSPCEAKASFNAITSKSA
jgi:hypothetical protein